MSKTIEQLSEITTAKGDDLLHIIDVSASQDMKMKKANFHNSKPFGSMFLSSNVTTTPLVVSTWANLVNGSVTTTQSTSNIFTHTNGRLTYPGDDSINVSVNLTANITVATASARIFIAVYKNGVLQTNMQIGVWVITGGTTLSPIATSGIMTMAKNDYLEVFLYNANASNPVTVGQMNLNVAQL